MDKKQIQRENLKNILYSIFDNYGDLSKKIYIVKMCIRDSAKYPQFNGSIGAAIMAKERGEVI